MNSLATFLTLWPYSVTEYHLYPVLLRAGSKIAKNLAPALCNYNARHHEIGFVQRRLTTGSTPVTHVSYHHPYHKGNGEGVASKSRGSHLFSDTAS